MARAEDVWVQVDQLVDVLRATPEYTRLEAAREQVEQREAARLMLRDLRTMQAELEQRQAAGEPLTEEALAQWEQRMQLVSFNPYVREYLEAEIAFAQLFVAVQGRLTAGLGLTAGETDGGGGEEPGRGPLDTGGTMRASTEKVRPPKLSKPSSRLWTPG